MFRFVVNAVIIALAVSSASANNVAIDVAIDPPASPLGYLPGDIVRVAVRLRDETTDVNSLELVQVDLKVTNATLVPQFDPNDSTNPITDAVIFGGAAPGDGQMPPGGDPQDWDGYPGPPLPGCPANCLVGSVPSAVGGGTIYFWLRTSTNTAHLLNPPAPSSLGLLFIQFKIEFATQSTVVADALGPAVDDGSSSGAFFQQAGTGTIWSNGDADTGDNISGGILDLIIFPEPASLSLLGIGALVTLCRRHRSPSTHDDRGARSRSIR
ncbi:MAG TPA: PEP-CTERM sorting domain-containing protein [Phycisphaerae bacterium]|jgi:hypothetical protein